MAIAENRQQREQDKFGGTSNENTYIKTNRRNSDGSEHEDPALTIVNAIESLNFDLNASSFSETTDISNDYIADSLLLNFTTSESKTITILDPNGTIIIGGTEDQTCKNPLYNTTKKNFNIPINRSFNADDNLTVTITQASGVCIVDVVLKVQEGESTLNGTPVLGAGNEIIGQVKVTDGISVAGIDPITDVLETDSHRERMINEGQHFFYKTYVDFTGGQTQYFMFKSPSLPTRANAFVHLSSNVEFDVSIYKDSTTTDDGVDISSLIQNNDQNSSTTPEMIPYAGPTVDNIGTLVWLDKVGDGKDAGVGGLNYKIKAKSDSNYVFKIENQGDAGWISIDFWWYENL